MSVRLGLSRPNERRRQDQDQCRPPQCLNDPSPPGSRKWLGRPYSIDGPRGRHSLSGIYETVWTFQLVNNQRDSALGPQPEKDNSYCDHGKGGTLRHRRRGVEVKLRHQPRTSCASAKVLHSGAPGKQGDSVEICTGDGKAIRIMKWQALADNGTI